MAPAAAAAVPLTFLLLLVGLPQTRAIYCDEDDCYDLLRVSLSANGLEINKACYQLSLKYLPDKNPDPDSRKLFVKIANASEAILMDGATREQYDYAIAHPEEVFYNTARYYHAYYGHKTDARAVILVLLLVLSAFQYLNQWTRNVKLANSVGVAYQEYGCKGLTPTALNKRPRDTESVSCITYWISEKEANKLTSENSYLIYDLGSDHVVGTTYDKTYFFVHSNKIEEDLSKELDLQIQVADRPFYVESNGSPVFTVAIYYWQDESTKDELVQKRLSEKANMENFLSDMKKESKRRR